MKKKICIFLLFAPLLFSDSSHVYSSFDESSSPHEETEIITQQLEEQEAVNLEEELTENTIQEDTEASSFEDNDHFAVVPEITRTEQKVTQIPHYSPKIMIDFRYVFSGAPIIYTLLFLLSIAAVGICLYSLFMLKTIQSHSSDITETVNDNLQEGHYEVVEALCENQPSLYAKMILAALNNRKHGPEMMFHIMSSEGKRHSVSFWQNIALLNDIAIIAPMIGLLGTVAGMFYAFYNMNRSLESISSLFDGLGISVGTTIGGLIVAILAMGLYALLKFRLVRTLTSIENEANSSVSWIETPQA